jgi:peptide/nickel transport system substrate-binding protein
MRSRWSWLIPLVAAGLVATACGGDDDDAGGGNDGSGASVAPSAGTSGDGGSEPVAGGAITIALGSEPTSLDPHLVDDGGERAINDNVYETLLTRTPDGELAPGLATELPTQVDDTTWEFTLRDGVVFHNGEPFNADSVVATIERMVGLVERGETDNDGFYATLTGAEAVDATTVRIMTAEADGVLPARMYWLKQIPASARDTPDLSDAPVGTGPYTFVDRQQGVSIELAANPDYWGDAPSVSTVTYEFADDASTRLAGLKSGKYDLITNLAPQDVGQAPKSETVQGQEHPIIILDADDGITADRNVRIALNLAVDKEAIAANTFGGQAVVDAGQLLSPSILGFNAELEPYAYDPDEAKRLLEEAGVAGQPIQLVGESGRWLKDRELLEAVAGYWTEAGLEVQLEILEFGAYLDVLFDRENRADAIYVSSSNDLLDPDRQLSTYYEAGGVGSSNTNTELASLIAAGRSELDPDARAELYHQAVQLAYDEALFVWLVNNQDIYGLAEHVEWQPRVDAKLLVSEMSVTE